MLLEILGPETRQTRGWTQAKAETRHQILKADEL